MIKNSIILIMGTLTISIAPEDTSAEFFASDDEESLFQPMNDTNAVYFRRAFVPPRVPTPPTTASTPDTANIETAVEALYNKQGSFVGHFRFDGLYGIREDFEYTVDELSEYLARHKCIEVVLGFSLSDTWQYNTVIYFKGPYAYKAKADKRPARILKVIDLLRNIFAVQQSESTSVEAIGAALKKFKYKNEYDAASKTFTIKYTNNKKPYLISLRASGEKVWPMKIVSNIPDRDQYVLLETHIPSASIGCALESAIPALVECVQENNKICKR